MTSTTSEAEERERALLTETLWPVPLSVGCVDNSSAQKEGKTKKGTHWKYSVLNSRDNEDNDTTYTFTLGDHLIFKNDDEKSRDFSEDKYSVYYRGQRVYDSGDMRCRDGNHEDRKYNGLEELKAVLEATAAAEGVTPHQLLTALPIGLPGMAAFMSTSPSDTDRQLSEQRAQPEISDRSGKPPQPPSSVPPNDKKAGHGLACCPL